MGGNVEKTKKELKSSLTRIGSALGINPTMFDIYMELFLSTRPLGLKEISDATGYSISTVCNNMEAIENLLDVRKFRRPGSKKEYYECQNDLTMIYRKKIIRAREILPQIIQALREAEHEIGMEDAAMVERITGRRQDYERLVGILDKMEGSIYAKP